MTKQMTVRVEPDLLDAIERAAAEDRRPVSSLVRCILADWQAARDAQQQERAAA
jgi:hypothetical protein